MKTVLWTGTIESEPDPVTGKRKRAVVRARTKVAALEKMKEARQRLDLGVRHDAGLTVAQFLNDWLALVVVARAGSPNTVSNYSQVVRLHLIPTLGKLKLRELTAQHVDQLLKAKVDQGFSKNYVARMRSVLGDALDHAERRRLVVRNEARLSIMPKCEPTPEPRTLTKEEAAAFLSAARSHRLAAMLQLMVAVGLRPGEASGLLWEDVDLEAGTVAITGSMKRVSYPGRKGYELVRGSVKKSTGGERLIGLPAGIIPVIVAHRGRQEREREAAGSLWREQGLVFSSVTGRPLDPSNVRRAVIAVAKKAGIEGRVQPYTARHTAVSVLIDSGVPLDQVADLIGDDPRTVLRHYRHRIRPVIDAAAKGPFDVMLGSLAEAEAPE